MSGTEDPLPSATRPRTSWIVRTAPYLPWLALVTVPVFAGIGAIKGNWTPVSDWGVLASHVIDPPLIGMPSSVSAHTGVATRHPGPLLFWVLAGPTRLFGAPGYGLIVGAVLVNVVTLAAILWMVRRFRSRALVIWVAVFLALLAHGLGAQTLRDPMNTTITVLPMVALLVATWAFISGDVWTLPILVVAGSLPAQAHVTDGPLFAAMLALAMVAALTTMRAGRRREADPTRRVLYRRVLPVSAALFLVCWSAPIYDQFAGSGNLGRMLDTGANSTLGDRSGLAYGVRLMLDSIAPVPGWMRENGGGAVDPITTARVVAGLFVLAAIAAIGVWALRTRRRPVSALCITALVGCAAGVATSAQVPTDLFSGISPANRVFWWPIGMIAWLALCWGGATMVGTLLTGDRWRVVPKVGAAAGIVMVLVLVVIGLTGTDTGPNADAGSGFYAPVRQIAAAIADQPRPPTGYRVTLDDDNLRSLFILHGVVAELRLRDIDVSVPRGMPDKSLLLDSLATSYPVTSPDQPTILIRTGKDVKTPPGFRLLATYDPANPPKMFRGYDRGVFVKADQPTSVFIRP